MPCENLRLTDERKAAEPKRENDGLQLDARKNPPGTLVTLSYFPGFTPDRTSWDTRLSEEGVISQEVLWHRPGEPRRIEVMVQSITPEALCEVQRLMTDLLRIAGLEEIERSLNTIDDWQMGTLAFPGSSFSLQIPLHCYSSGLSMPQERLCLQEAEIISGFEALWDIIDRHSPLKVPRPPERTGEDRFKKYRKSPPR